MTKKYKILAEFAKDISCEIPNIEAFIKAKDNIPKYILNIDINSKPLKNKIIEVNIILKFQDKNLEKKETHFEITYTAIARIDESVTDKKVMQKIILSEIPNEINSKLEDLFLSLVKKSGFSDVKIEGKVDFEKLYNEKFN